MNEVVSMLTPQQAGSNLHMTIILGLPAIVLLGVGTLLYFISHEKYTFAHGVLAGLSLLLTTINILTILPMTSVVLSVPGIDLFHLIHIIVGAVGYIFGLAAFVTGISGVRTKVPGLIAFVCWTTVFVMGYVQFLM
ncbi:MAG: hypothetical protein JSW61_07635 [Candidatus Thorarchaeota archaeon]|nr:MAG: hypothetical protein JSW61_07635 [Candidatus Thorarchaeota archaeon]